ncbi:CoB--CoM heterodisulfide reductase subunit B [candidate division WOR-3 bacterium]|uniref:CoB--CoM heterodisulfide reductase subunit B n=1 Tax=candidate division WOR-3 bacterium TaxID=2052148 RepID=A0A660SJU1_UNCW3|nr:MAG: CoB--CoM heterodisulfide reductase subunit B [candidate division WOR-3 bacterium]
MSSHLFFLGCTVPVRGQNYELSARKVAERLGIKLIDEPDFACCGFPVRSSYEDTAFLLAARNLAIAEERGGDIITLCSSCTATLSEVSHRLRTDPDRLKWTNRHLKEIGKKIQHPVSVKHFARFLYDEIGIERIKEKVERPLTQLTIAPHYGCHYLKPSHLFGEDPEIPHTLDELITATGARVVEYEEKKLCCGGAILGIDEDVALTMAHKKLTSVKGEGADGLALICPFCAIMFDDLQRKVDSKFNTNFNLPILYYPQLLGLAFGIPETELGFKFNKVKAKGLLS